MGSVCIALASHISEGLRVKVRNMTVLYAEALGTTPTSSRCCSRHRTSMLTLDLLPRIAPCDFTQRHSAVGHSKAVEILLEAPNVDCRTERRPLYAAALSGHSKAVEILLEAPNVVDCRAERRSSRGRVRISNFTRDIIYGRTANETYVSKEKCAVNVGIGFESLW